MGFEGAALKDKLQQSAVANKLMAKLMNIQLYGLERKKEGATQRDRRVRETSLTDGRIT